MIFDSTADPAAIELWIAGFARRVALARTDPAELLSLVMREETTRVELDCLPHQHVIFDFVAAHDACVLRLPAGYSKTYSMTALTLHMLGLDPTERGAVISSTEGQAAKVVHAAADYIEHSDELRLVFPDLRRSPRISDPWTQTKITVDRPHGIRDPSLTAVGVDGALPGSRLSWILVDDILSRKNTATPDSRKLVSDWFFSTVLNRRDAVGAKLVVCNTPWIPSTIGDVGDLTYMLAKRQWPVLNMDAIGNIWFENTDWDTDAVRPSSSDLTGQMHRLVAHDTPGYAQLSGIAIPNKTTAWTDDNDQVPLWPERWNHAVLDGIRRDMTHVEFNRSFLMKCRSDDQSYIKQEWLDRCMQLAAEQNPPARGLIYDWRLPFPTFTGIDPAIGRKKSSDKSAIFTFAVLPGERRLILDIQAGRWSGAELIRKIIQTTQRYNSVAWVESNAAQDFIRQWAVREKADLLLRSHTTGRNKTDPRFGVESLFVELENACWIIPNDEGATDAVVSDWISEMLYYDPAKHTGDILMAAWVAREGARRMGFLAHGAHLAPHEKAPTPGSLAKLLSR